MFVLNYRTSSKSTQKQSVLFIIRLNSQTRCKRGTGVGFPRIDSSQVQRNSFFRNKDSVFFARHSEACKLDEQTRYIIFQAYVRYLKSIYQIAMQILSQPLYSVLATGLFNQTKRIYI